MFQARKLCSETSKAFKINVCPSPCHCLFLYTSIEVERILRLQLQELLFLKTVKLCAAFNVFSSNVWVHTSFE